VLETEPPEPQLLFLLFLLLAELEPDVSEAWEARECSDVGEEDRVVIFVLVVVGSIVRFFLYFCHVDIEANTNFMYRTQNSGEPKN
jgi:hypothetical protein